MTRRAWHLPNGRLFCPQDIGVGVLFEGHFIWIPAARSWTNKLKRKGRT